MQKHVYASPAELIEGLAEFFIETVNHAIKKNGHASVVLSGGSSPKQLFELLASTGYKSKIDWSKISFFFADERYVPADHPDYNGGMVKKSLFDPLMIDSRNIYYMNTDLPPQKSAEEYSKNIRDFFQAKSSRFDLVLLGLGDDAHTASLFPGTIVLEEPDELVRNVYVEKLGAERITLSSKLINQADTICFLVYGSSKSLAVQKVIEGENDYQQYPAQLIKPNSGNLHWFIDEAAASKL